VSFAALGAMRARNTFLERLPPCIPAPLLCDLSLVAPPGHGRSPGPQRGFTMDECAEAAVQVLDAAGLRKSVVLLGTSWGGFVAPRIALRAPDRVRSMVLFNTSAERPTAFNRANAMLLTTLFAIGALDGVVNHLITSALLGPQTRRSQPQIEACLAMQLRTWDRRAVINTVRSVLVGRDGVLDALPGVSVPALIVSGEQDTILPSVLSWRIAEKMPNARHVEVPGAAHLVPLEVPNAANSLILDFIRE